jgi:hypothetical protein
LLVALLDRPNKDESRYNEMKAIAMGKILTLFKKKPLTRVFLLGLFIFLVVSFGEGCKKNPTDTSNPIAGSKPNYVTFRITVLVTALVNGVNAERNSDATEFNQSCNVPNGSTINVKVPILASGSYNVTMQPCDIRWNAVNLTLGNVYNVTITGGTIGSSSTMDSILCNGVYYCVESL